MIKKENDMSEFEKIFYNPGDIVKLKHNIINQPKEMYVVEKQVRVFKDRKTGEETKNFLGILCRWFDNNGVMQQALFSTKDLEHV